MSRKVKAAALAGLLAGLFALTGCGFTPLYGGGDVSDQLAQVKVARIPERTGQLLQLSVQDAMQRQGAPTAQLYLLTVDYNISQQSIGIQSDTSSSRNRFVATANWKLAPIGQPAQLMASGQATTEDAENVIDQQYFASELEENTLNRQLADQIAAQITSQVAVYFKEHG